MPKLGTGAEAALWLIDSWPSAHPLNRALRFNAFAILFSTVNPLNRGAGDLETFVSSVHSALTFLTLKTFLVFLIARLAEKRGGPVLLGNQRSLWSGSSCSAW
jgi:hypothetical protein